MLKLSGLADEEMKVYEVPIWDEIGAIRTTEVGFPNDKDGLDLKPKLVFMHGFQGSGALFFELFKPLQQHFHCYFVDIVGMGCSSRPSYDKNQSPQKLVDYFMSFFEEWRTSCNISDFYLCGHSFGGYICSLYSIRYPQHVKKLMLISPIGLMQKPENFDVKRVSVVPLRDKDGKAVENKGPP